MADNNKAITAALDQYYSDLDSKAKEDQKNAAMQAAYDSLTKPDPNAINMGDPQLGTQYTGGPISKGQVAGAAVGLAGAPLLPETAIGGLLGSMLLGGASGATQGAIDNPKDRFAGATSSGLMGAAMGAVPGLAMMKGRPMGELPLPTKANLFLKMIKGLGLGAPEAAAPAAAEDTGLSYGPRFAGSRFSTAGERPVLGPLRGEAPAVPLSEGLAAGVPGLTGPPSSYKPINTTINTATTMPLSEAQRLAAVRNLANQTNLLRLQSTTGWNPDVPNPNTIPSVQNLATSSASAQPPVVKNLSPQNQFELVAKQLQKMLELEKAAKSQPK